ncbi:WecB/TagA/CpsF family glycosyltransferase [Flavihumibacter fluvii]|uniref:WecB/TagA/CpsF family glycosyltransferase n=1 Tax=Flavihumibacter fluvii TaxID=2838157 RepID=UPI001BDEECFA|nr:WecB/TagA/CpsF family glycosyltransferase [Flavihumibacter fluvii]ULQ54430.1 WecB/TagA/CpsF family glycosyltransferase [Flavihumibacter fluvii]
MNSRISICGIPVDPITMQETIDMIDVALAEKKPIHHVVINAAKVVNANKDKELKESIVHCDIINADGQGVVWASRFLRKPLPERVAGIDLMGELVKLAYRKRYKIFFLGAKEEIVKKVVDVYSAEYGNQVVAGYRNGYFSTDDELLIAQQIGQSKADILFVAMSSPKKEIFLNKYKKEINVPFIMGVGGSFDVVAGFVHRAPGWMQKYGLEWFYRVIQEPGRMWKRYLFGNLEFAYLVVKEKIGYNSIKK